MLIDTVGAAGTLILVFVAHLYGEKKRNFPTMFSVSWGIYLLYYIVRTFFSDDIGYSVYTTIRMIDAFLICYVFYCFSSDEDRKVFPRYVLGFSLFSLFVSIVYTLTPFLRSTLPNTNLLVPSYGHNHVVDILFFGIPIAFFGAVWKKNNRWYVLVLLCLLGGVVFSFARAAMLLVGIFLFGGVIFLWKKISSKQKILWSTLFVGVVVLCSIFFITPQSFFQKYFHTAVVPRMEKKPIGADGRLEYFRQAIEGVKDKPFFGSGPGTFILVSKHFQKALDTYSRHAHNIILEEGSDGGIVGIILLLCLLCWCARNIYRHIWSLEHQKRFPVFVLAISCLLSFLYALFDFTMSFFVVSVLFWSTIGIVMSSVEKKQSRQVPISSFISYGAILVVFIFYGLQFFCFTGFVKKDGIFAYVYYLSEGTTMEFLKKNNSIEKNKQELFLLLHKKNPQVLDLLGQQYLDELMVLDPKNFSVQKKYFQSLLEHKEYEKVGLALQSMNENFLLPTIESTSSGTLLLKNDLEKILDSIDFTDPFLKRAYSLVDSEIDSTNLRLSFAKYYYLLGFEMLSSNSVLTEKLWLVVMKLLPDWSYFPVELASFYYQRGDYTNAIKILNTCLYNSNASAHCKNTSFSNMPIPGFFRDDVILLPKEGTLIEKQMNKMDNQKDNSLLALQLMVKNSDSSHISSYIRELTDFYLKNEEKHYIDEINYFDPIVLTVLSQLLEQQEWNGDRTFLAKLHYAIGLHFLKMNPSITEYVWHISSALLPDWPYFSIELAALHAKEKDYIGMFDFLLECQKNSLIQKYCLNFSIANISIPGYFQDDIWKIPKDGIFLEKQMDWKNVDQKKTLDALVNLINTNDIEKVSLFFNKITVYAMKRRGKSFILQIDLYDKEILEKISTAIFLLRETPLNIADWDLLAKIYYLVGYSYLNSSPGQTEFFWKLASQLLPEWSYFSVELANLYHEMNEPTKVLNILYECQKNRYAADHCKEIGSNNFQKPGFFYNKILKIPKE